MTGGNNRRISYIKAIRKRRLIRTYGYNPFDNLHQYSKNKIHCSCPLCSAKTRNNGHKISDKRKIDRMEYLE